MVEAIPQRRIHQPDINGTHVPLNEPISAQTEKVFRRFMALGHVFGPNTSHTIKKVEANLRGLVNGVYITELGGAVYDADAKTLLKYYPLLPDERVAIADFCATRGLGCIQTAAFFPRFSGQANHGSEVYIHPAVTDEAYRKLFSRHYHVEHVTRSPIEFARWIGKAGTNICMFEWRPINDDVNDTAEELNDFNVSYDSGGTLYVTRRAVNKASTFLEVIDTRYKVPLSERISIAGDSPPTDGPLFQIPFITKIAVGDRSLLDETVQGRNLYAATPEAAGKVLRMIMLESTSISPPR